MPTLVKSPRTSLEEAVLQNSIACDFNQALKEWRLFFSYQATEENPQYCACGQHIYHCEVINNIHTKKRLVIGSTCINKFMDDVIDVSAKFINSMYLRGIINSWECEFLKSLPVKKKLSERQLPVYTRINTKILNSLH